LINLDMGAFGSGSMSDPLRHAVGMRTAQDECKMRMWNSFPSLFQNTIFHGEQDAKIKALRHSGSMQERLAHCKELKEAGNTLLKTATATVAASPKASETSEEDTMRRKKREAMAKKVSDLEEAVLEKEQELRLLRRDLALAKSELAEAAAPTASAPSTAAAAAIEGGAGSSEAKEVLEKAISSYEKAAGLLRYVECVRPDWRNDDGSYKGIEDKHLRVDAVALEGDSPEAQEARDLVASCYLNAALAAQRLEDWPKMRSACDEVLAHVNPNSVKALYRRAQARVAPQSALDADRAAAIQDLHAAAQLAPQDKDVRGLLAKLKAERRRQEASDRSTFAGMFERGEVVTNDPRAETGDKPPKLDLNDPRVQAMLDVRPGPGGFADA